MADDDSAVTEFETPASLPVTANDIAYGGASIVVGTIDLDPTAAGRQTSAAVAGGTFAAQPDGSVLFTPAAGFSGKAARLIHRPRQRRAHVERGQTVGDGQAQSDRTTHALLV